MTNELTATPPVNKWWLLGMNTLAFTVNFAVWTMFSVIGIRIKSELGLSEMEFGILIAIPILTGSISRLPLGLLTDWYGGRSVFLVQMFCVAIPTFGLAFANAYWQYLLIGLFVGLAGGSFAIGITYTSACFEKKYQGTAMGIFGVGNAGAAVTNLLAPFIIAAMGWRAVPISYGVMMLLMIALFWYVTRGDSQHSNTKNNDNIFTGIKGQLAPLKSAKVARYCLYYCFSFGGFVALALWLPKYYVEHYALDLTTASLITIIFTLPSGVIRALGGWCSDIYGGRAVNWGVFFISFAALLVLTFNNQLSVEVFTALVFVVGLAQGFGKASTYRIIHDHFPNNMGSVGGIVGVVGGLGGFILPISFGFFYQLSSYNNSCFAILLLMVVASMAWMRYSRHESVSQRIQSKAQQVSVGSQAALNQVN